MQKLIHEKYNLELFKTHSVKELTLLWGISKARVYKIKQKVGYETKKISSRKSKILEYLKNTNGEIVSVRKLCRDLGISTNGIRLSYLINLSQLNGIILKFVPKIVQYKHSHYRYLNGCDCDICKLANNLSVHAVKYFNRVYSEFLNEYANKNVNNYIADKSVHKKQFYLKFKEQYSKFLETKPLRIKTKSNRKKKTYN